MGGNVATKLKIMIQSEQKVKIQDHGCFSFNGGMKQQQTKLARGRGRAEARGEERETPREKEQGGALEHVGQTIAPTSPTEETRFGGLTETPARAPGIAHCFEQRRESRAGKNGGELCKEQNETINVASLNISKYLAHSFLEHLRG